jgi:hypothetical protein
MSVGEAAGAAALCPAGAACVLCGAAVGEGACAPERSTPTIISPAIAMHDSHNRKPIDFWLTPISHPARFVVM